MNEEVKVNMALVFWRGFRQAQQSHVIRETWNLTAAPERRHVSGTTQSGRTSESGQFCKTAAVCFNKRQKQMIE